MNRRLKQTGAGLAATFGVIGGLALGNRWLVLDDLPPTLPGAMHDWTWRGYRVRYTTLGSGPSVVLVHGIFQSDWRCFGWLGNNLKGR